MSEPVEIRALFGKNTSRAMYTARTLIAGVLKYYKPTRTRSPEQTDLADLSSRLVLGAERASAESSRGDPDATSANDAPPCSRRAKYARARCLCCSHTVGVGVRPLRLRLNCNVITC